MQDDRTEMHDRENPLRPLVAAWNKKIVSAKKHKKDKFDSFADEIMAFYTGPTKDNGLWEKYMKKGAVDAPKVAMEMCLAKPAEFVQIFGPHVYSRNPVRQVTTRKNLEVERAWIVPPELDAQMQQLEQQQQQMQQQVLENPGLQQDPAFLQQYAAFQQQLAAVQPQWQEMDGLFQQLVQAQSQKDIVHDVRSRIMSQLINYTPNENDLKGHSRQAIDESLLKGAGCLWVELEQPYPDAPSTVGSFFESIDRLQMDPDAESMDKCWWISRECSAPAWELADKYGEDEEYLRKQAKIGETSATAESEDLKKKRGRSHKGKTNDIITYYKIYSKMGIGDRLNGVPDKLRNSLEEFGDFVYLVLVPGVPYFLNLPNDLLEEIAAGPDPEVPPEEQENPFDEAFGRVQWPIPFFADKSWPVFPIWYHTIPGELWPMAHLRPALPELKFLNWTYSYLADQVRHTSRIYMAIKKGIDEDLEADIRNGAGFTVLKVGQQADGEKLRDIIDIFNHPPGNKDLQELAAAVQLEFDKRTGLSELMYGSQGGMRSATEAQIKGEAKNVRPDDMANQVEDWMSKVARAEALAWVFLGAVEDVEPILGPAGAFLWQKYYEQAEEGFRAALELEYRIEAGSARKPNKETAIQQANEVLQVVVPILMSHAESTGEYEAVNAWFGRWAKANDIEDPEQFYLNPPPPPPPPEADPQVQLKLEQQQAEHEQEITHRQEEHTQKLDHTNSEQQLKLKFEEEKAEIDVERQRNQATRAAN